MHEYDYSQRACGPKHNVPAPYSQRRFSWCVAADISTLIQISRAVLSAMYKFSIDEHALTVIAADGIAITPVPGVHQLPIALAQRVSLLIQTRSAP